jgi:hypothetical protein
MVRLIKLESQIPTLGVHLSTKWLSIELGWIHFMIVWDKEVYNETTKALNYLKVELAKTQEKQS